RHRCPWRQMGRPCRRRASGRAVRARCRSSTMNPARRHTAPASRLRRLAATNDAGSSTAEAALLAPLLIAVLLFVVLCGRLVSAQMDLDAAASAAARAASLARSDGAARAEADRTARDTLTARGVTCQQVTVSV